MHDNAVVGRFDDDVAVGAHVDVGDQLVIHGLRVNDQADGPVIHRLLQHKVMVVALMVLPVADLSVLGQQHIADQPDTVAAVHDVSLCILHPQVGDGIAAGQVQGLGRILPQLAGGGIQPVGVFFQREADAVGDALDHQLHLLGLAVDQGALVVLPGLGGHQGQHCQQQGTHCQRQQQGAEPFSGGRCWAPVGFRGIFHGNAPFQTAAERNGLLLPRKNVILFSISAEWDMVRPGKEVWQHGVSCSYCRR